MVPEFVRGLLSSTQVGFKVALTQIISMIKREEKVANFASFLA